MQVVLQVVNAKLSFEKFYGRAATGNEIADVGRFPLSLAFPENFRIINSPSETP